MRIVVTGGSGRLASAVARELLAHGHEVIPLDIRPRRREAEDLPELRIVDLTDAEQLLPHVQGADAVCHLGNVPSFARTGPSVGFRNNVVSTFNVFHAAELAGVRRVVSASSIQAYGIIRGIIGTSAVRPEYLPVDEDHPLRPSDGYPLSKATGEWIADAFVRRNPELTAYSLRFTLIIQAPEEIPHFFRRPEDCFPTTLHTYIRSADAARCVRLCCESPRPGHTALNVACRRAHAEWHPDQIKAVYGEVPEFRKEVGRDQSLIDTARAERVVGFIAEQ
jgi:nucleoside-diphosphate-sugar epimerase